MWIILQRIKGSFADSQLQGCLNCSRTQEQVHGSGNNFLFLFFLCGKKNFQVNPLNLNLFLHGSNAIRNYACLIQAISKPGLSLFSSNIEDGGLGLKLSVTFVRSQIPFRKDSNVMPLR